jgi:hypothetical protein
MAANHKQNEPVPTDKLLSMDKAFEHARQRANKGDRKAQEALKKCLDRQQLWDRFGDLADHAERSLIARASGGEWLTGEAIRRKVAKMRRELAGASPSPLEELAVRRLVACWLNLQDVQMQSVQRQQDLGWAKFWLKRLEVAHKLYKSAEQSLAEIRELLPPVVQNGVGARAEIPVGVQETNGHGVAAANGKRNNAAREEVATGSPATGVNRIAARMNGHNRMGQYLDPVGALAEV